MKFLITISFVVSFVAFLKSPEAVKLWALFPAVFAVLYVLPVFPFYGNKTNLRKVKFLKTFMVAIVWAAMTVILPATIVLNENTHEVALVFMQRFVFILAITIPFDIRDMNFDKHIGIVTFPLKFGIRRTKEISCALLLLFFAVSVFYFYFFSGSIDNGAINSSGFNFSIAIFISTSATIFLVSKLDQSKSEYWYTFALDGMMILQFLTLSIAHFKLF